MGQDSLLLHLDMDAFFASIEQQVNPALRGKPLIVGGRNQKYRSVVCAASYEAKALGIDSAMPSWKALRICPEAVFVPADTTRYLFTSREIFEILKTFSPQTEMFAIDEFFLDLTGCSQLLGSLETISLEIKQRIHQRFGLTSSIGIAPTKVTAKMAAKTKKPDGLVIWRTAAEARAGLRNLPVEKICGVGSQLKRRLNLLGVMTCADLAEFPDRILQQHFGVVGRWLKAVCRAEDAGDIRDAAQPSEIPKSVGHSQTLPEVTHDQDYIHSWMYLLSEMVGERLRRQELQARTVHFYYSDGFSGGWGRQRTFIEPTDDGQEIFHRCLDIIESGGIRNLNVRVLAISTSQLVPAQKQFLFEKQIKRMRLLEYVDTINHRFGEWTIFPAAVLTNA